MGDKKNFKNEGYANLWKFFLYQSSKKHRIRKKNYKKYLIGLTYDDYHFDISSLDFPTIMRFISTCNTRFAFVSNKKPTYKQLQKTVYDVKHDRTAY